LRAEEEQRHINDHIDSTIDAVVYSMSSSTNGSADSRRLMLLTDTSDESLLAMVSRGDSPSLLSPTPSAGSQPRMLLLVEQVCHNDGV
jgi:hypothetical protein